MKQKIASLVILFALLGAALSMSLLLNLDTFGWDEAHHAFFGNQIYNDLRAFNVGRFFYDTGQQAWFQPFHSYLDAVFFLLLGRNYFAARASSLFMYLIVFYIAYKLSMKISKDNGRTIAAVSAFLLATAPMALLLSCVNMQEMAGAAVISASLLYYMYRCNDKFNIVNYLILGLILSLVLLVKYHYGILLGAAVFLLEFSRIFDVKDKMASFKRFIVSNLTIFAGFVPLAAFWFFTPDSQRKIALFFFRVQVVQVGDYNLNLFQRALFYIQTIITVYTFSLWIGVLLIALLIYSFKYYKDINVRCLQSIFIVFFVFHSVIITAFERLIMPAMPAVFILAAFSLTDIWAKAVKMFRPHFYKIAIAVFALVILGDLVFIRPFTIDFANAGTATFKKNYHGLRPPFLFGLVKRPSFFTEPLPSTKQRPDFPPRTKGRLRDMLDFCRATIPHDKQISTMMSFLQISPYEFYWAFADWKAPVYTMNDYPYIRQYFWFSEYFIEFTLKNTSPYIGEGSLKSWDEASKPFKQRGWLKLYASKEIADLGITVNIYKMKLPF